MSVETTVRLIVPAKLGNPTISRIIRAFSRLTGTSVEDLAGPSQAATISHHRHRLMYLIREIDPTASYSLIGRHLGSRDMATVHQAVTKIAMAVEQSYQVATELAAIEAEIRNDIRQEVDAPGPWQLLAACQVLRDDKMTDAEARKVALGFLQQLEASHG